MPEATRLARFEEIVLPHLNAAYNLARWLVRNEHDAQDAVQEAYLRAYRFFDGFHGGDGRAWLLAIVRNTCRTSLHQAGRMETVAEFDEDLHSRYCSSVGPEARMIQQSNADSVRQCIEELPAEYKEALVMREMEEMSYKEIAEATSVPVGTVMSRLARARARLQNCLMLRLKGAPGVTCDSVRELIQPLVDQELDIAQRLEIEAHLRSCVGCAEFLHELTELRKAVREKAPHYQAPEHMAGRVRTALRAAEKAEARRRLPWAWLAAAASLGFAAAILWGVIVLRSPGGSQQDLLAQELVSSHVRSLMPGHLVDVPTSDQHTVKPWFSGKLDFSPDVRDLTDQGFRLTGGRLDYLNQRAVAALAFQRRQHIINLFIWPSGDKVAGAAPSQDRNGFHIVHWTSSGLEYWAVSDLNAAELQDFARWYEK